MVGKDEILGRLSKSDLDESYEAFFTPLPRTGLKLNETLKAFKSGTFAKHYRHFIPKLYQNVSQFHDWRIPAAVSMLGFAGGSQHKEELLRYQAYVNLLSFTLLWTKHQNPMFFVDKQVLPAIQSSNFPTNLDFTGFRLPHPAQAFVFPIVGAPTYQGIPVKYVGIAHVDSDIESPLGKIDTRNNNKFVVTTGFYPDNFVACGFQYASLDRVLKMDTDQYLKESHNPNHGAKIDVNEGKFTHDLLKLAIQCVLVMQARPELVEGGKKISVVKSGSARSELWSPNIIGRKYKTLFEGEGHHSSPRSHWRAGHFRRQPIGPRVCLCSHSQAAHDPHCQHADCDCQQYVYVPFDHKTIWIEPILVCPSN